MININKFKQILYLIIEMNKYNNSIIYTIKCLDQNIKDFYIGSTTNFNRRKAQHHYCCYNEKRESFNYKLYKCIRDNSGWENWTMKEIIKVNCNNREELHKIEGEYIKLFKPSLNKRIEGRTRKLNNKKYDKEYRTENKEKLKNYHKKYYQENKHKIIENESIKVKCECGYIMRKSSLSRHKKTKKHINNLKFLSI